MEPSEFFTIVGSAAAVLGILITWMTRRFDKLDAEIKEVSKDSNAKWMAAMTKSDQLSLRMDKMIIAMNERTDELIKAGNARFDAITTRIDKMLEKQGK